MNDRILRASTSCSEDDLFRAMSLVAWLRGEDKQRWASLKRDEAAMALESVIATARDKDWPPKEMQISMLEDDKQRLAGVVGDIRNLVADLYSDRGEDQRTAEVCRAVLALCKSA